MMALVQASTRVKEPIKTRNCRPEAINFCPQIHTFHDKTLDAAPIAVTKDIRSITNLLGGFSMGISKRKQARKKAKTKAWGVAASA